MIIPLHLLPVSFICKSSVYFFPLMETNSWFFPLKVTIFTQKTAAQMSPRSPVSCVIQSGHWLVSPGQGEFNSSALTDSLIGLMGVFSIMTAIDYSRRSLCVWLNPQSAPSLLWKHLTERYSEEKRSSILTLHMLIKAQRCHAASFASFCEVFIPLTWIKVNNKNRSWCPCYRFLLALWTLSLWRTKPVSYIYETYFHL